jgi:hypothetical protein
VLGRLTLEGSEPAIGVPYRVDQMSEAGEATGCLMYWREQISAADGPAGRVEYWPTQSLDARVFACRFLQAVGVASPGPEAGHPGAGAAET